MKVNLHELSAAVGARVRAARADAGISRKRLAAVADVSERYLNELENGEANASLGVLARVAEALAIDLVTLVGGGTATVNGANHAASGITHSPLGALLSRMSLREQEGAVAVLERYLADHRRSLRGIALLGLRGAGKTTIGRLFSERHGLPFLSVTREVETRAGMSLNDLFNLGGPDAYRTLENEVVSDLAGRNDRIVLETAGGIVSNAPALEQILSSFKTVWLKASPEEHLSRVVQQGDMRPMQATPPASEARASAAAAAASRNQIAGETAVRNSHALEHLKSLLAAREPEYARAEAVLDTSGRTPQACTDELERIAGA